MRYYFRSSDTYSYCVPQIREQWIALIWWTFRRAKERHSKGRGSNRPRMSASLD
jgi:hypothetical protein